MSILLAALINLGYVFVAMFIGAGIFYVLRWGRGIYEYPNYDIWQFLPTHQDLPTQKITRR